MSNTISRHIRPPYKAVSLSLGYALTVGEFECWQAFSVAIQVRLTESERAALAFSALRAQSPDQAAITADVVLNGAPETFLETPAERATIVIWREQRDRKRRSAA